MKKRENLRKNKERFTKELEEKQAELDKITEKLSKEALEIENTKTSRRKYRQKNMKNKQI